jgi:hypothetical protein
LTVTIHDIFPHLAAEGFAETSPATEDYNCIAWAAGVTDGWWWPDAGYTSEWPEGAPRVESLDAFFAAFALLDFERCTDGELEPGCEKIALYAVGPKPTHAARQLPDGSWTSKLGEYIDITHTLRGLESPKYGQVSGYMKRLFKKD